MLLLPFIASVAVRNNKVYCTEFEHVGFITNGDQCWCADTKQLEVELAATTRCRVANEVEQAQLLNKPMALASRAVIKPAVWTSLGRYAHKTYAPATEASRLSGAGAGLNDND